MASTSSLVPDLNGTGSAIHSAGSVTDQGFASKGQSRQPSEDQAAQTADAMKIAHDLQSATKSNFQSDNSINSNNEKGNPENRKQINHDLSNGVGEPAGRPSGPVFKVRWGRCPRTARETKVPRRTSPTKCSRCKKVVDDGGPYKKFLLCTKCFCKRVTDLADEDGWTPEEAAEFIRIANLGV